MSNQAFDNIEPDVTTVGELVAENYHAAGVLREYGMDFCCGGGISLRQACDKNRADLSEVMQRLRAIPWNESAAGENFNAWAPDYLIRHIVDRHHRFVREKVSEVGMYAVKVAHVHGQNHPENITIQQRFEQLSNGMIEHLQAEEQQVFPLITEVYEARMAGRDPGAEAIRALREELGRMVDDHEKAGSLIAEIRELSHNFTPPADACATYRVLYQNLEAFEEDLHLHVHLENNILFRKAEQLIESSD